MQLPRFLLERQYSLKDVLQKLGVTQVFQDDAEILNLGGGNAPQLNQVSKIAPTSNLKVLKKSVTRKYTDLV